MPLELGRRIAQMDGQHGQYPSTYLSPPPETNWRRYVNISVKCCFMTI